MTDQKLIFVVDDDPFITTLVVKRFINEGFRTEGFDFGEDCLKAMKKKPDLIILDYYFKKPGVTVMNGMEVFDKIKEINPEIPVIMLSSQEKGEIVLELARKGIDGYVIKDNHLIDNLLSTVKDLFEREN